METLRVLIVDDHPVFRFGMRANKEIGEWGRLVPAGFSVGLEGTCVGEAG